MAHDHDTVPRENSSAWHSMMRALNEAKADLQRLEMELEQRVEARTRDLSEREARLRALVGNLLDVILVFDADGQLVDATGNVMGITGYMREEILSYAPEEFWSTLFAARDSDLIRRDLMRVKASYSSAQSRVRVCDRAGEIRWCELVLVPLRDDENHFLGAEGILRDIGERVQTERIIHSLNKAAEGVQQASLSLERVLSTVSAELTALGFYSVIIVPGPRPDDGVLLHLGGEEMVIQTINELLMPEKIAMSDLLRHATPLSRALQQRQTILFPIDESFLARISGQFELPGAVRRSLIPLRAVTVPLVADDHVLGLLCVADRTLHQTLLPAIEVFANQTAIAIRNAQLLQRVLESEEQYRGIFQATRDGLLVITRSGELMEANPAACEMFGYSHGQLLQMDVAALFATDHPLDLPEFRDEVAARGHCELAAEGLRADAERFPVEVRGARLSFRGEEHLLAVVTDISERVKAQEALLHTERLRALGLMAGGIAHDFNNILMGIFGFTEEARHSLRSNPSQAEDDLAGILTSARDAAAAVSRLQSLYRDTDDTSDWVPVRLEDVVTEVLDITKPHWKDIPQRMGHTIRVERETQTQCPVLGNPSDLRRVLTNLVVNAAQAMPNGGVLTIKTGRQDTWSWVSVSDTGVGIAPEVRSRLFEPYFTTKKRTGRGLGLTISMDIVARHGGEIAFESTPGQGTTFIVRLPAYRAVPAIDAIAADEVSLAVGCVPDCRVLVVDDDEAVRVLLYRFLSRLGQDVTVACDGSAALDMLQERHFDLLITDLGMPDISGRQVAQQARSLRPDLPIILTTGWGDTMTSESLAEMHIAALLPKPFTFDRLASTLDKALHHPD